MRRIQISLVVALAVLASVGCYKDEPTAPLNAAAASRSVSGAQDVTVRLAAARDVPMMNIDMPRTPRLFDTNDSALVVEVQRARGRVFVAFKEAVRAKTVATTRLEESQLRPGRFYPKGTRAAVTAVTIRAGAALLQAQGAVIHNYLDAIGVVMADIDPDSARPIRANPLIDYIEPITGTYVLDRAIGFASPSLSALSMAVQSSQTIPWGIQLVRAPDAWSLTTGFGARILIIDDGIGQAQHPDLPVVPPGNCFGAYGGCDETLAGAHGVGVEGVLAARNNTVGVVGMVTAAPNLFSWGACDGAIPSNCYFGEIANALNWAANNLGPGGVINMSFSGSQNNLGVANAVQAAWLAGNTLVASGGNTGSFETVRYPASYDNVLGVSGVRSDTSFASSSPCGGTGSSWGPHIDVAAPFQALTTDVPSFYFTYCGNTYSTPHVAGAAALIFAYHPSWTNTDVFRQLQNYSMDRGTLGYDEQFGNGVLQADLVVGYWQPTQLTGSVVGGKPRITWEAVPLAERYDIYRRVTPTIQPLWTFCASTTSTTFTDATTPVNSFYGINTYPPTYPLPAQVAVSYEIRSVNSRVLPKTGSYATFLPKGTPAPTCG